MAAKAALLARVGVSGTALYRHFDDKAALLARVDAEGFRLLFETMARVIANSSDERHDVLHVMGAGAAFDQLVEVVRAEQQRDRIGPGDPVDRAEIIWAFAHGISTLAAARHLPRTTTTAQELAVVGCGFLQRDMGE